MIFVEVIDQLIDYPISCASLSIRCPHEGNFASLAIKNTPGEDSDQTERMRRLIWIFWTHMSEDPFSDVPA